MIFYWLIILWLDIINIFESILSENVYHICVIKYNILGVYHKQLTHYCDKNIYSC